jgi:ABC-type glutathione transport system ATPase component
LPWAAVLRGREAFHASAVGFRGQAVAMVGETGAGKTSLALQLVRGGMEFFTDDVLALERADGVVRAHPGAGIASVRTTERAAIPDATWARLGQVLGHSGKTYVEVPRADRPLPLGRIYFLGTGAGPAIEPITRLDPRRLLASTFVLGVQTPSRLLNQLEVCSAIAREVPVFELRVKPGMASEKLAEMIFAHMTAESDR